MTDLKPSHPRFAHARQRRAGAGTSRWLRWLLAGPAALLLSILAMASLPLVLPAGAGGVNHLVLPVILFPCIWAGLIVWPVATDRIGRAGRIYGALTVAFILIIILTVAF